MQLPTDGPYCTVFRTCKLTELYLPPACLLRQPSHPCLHAAPCPCTLQYLFSADNTVMAFRLPIVAIAGTHDAAAQQ